MGKLKVMVEQKNLFDFLIKRVREVGDVHGLRPPQAFGRWFAEMYFQKPQDLVISDGSGDGKVDLFFHTTNGTEIQHIIINSKFTEKYNSLAPVEFYNEAISFWQAFKNSGNRENYLSKIVRKELRPKYKKLFDYYDKGTAILYFVTNCRRNDTQIQATKSSDIKFFHLDDILQFMVDYIEDAMPYTPELLLTGVTNILSTGREDSEVPTSIVFAKLADFISYMSDDPYDLLFARNVRLDLGKTPVNSEIQETFKNSPAEFAFSHNGVTLLCEKVVHDPGRHEVMISNPRVVNGSQTLHSIRNTERPSGAARVMVRIIEIPRTLDDLHTKTHHRKDIIHKISIRSNRQNNIKKWDLVSNDDFQHDLARYFRSQKIYYERRRKEWGSRRSELKSLGIRRGPEIKGLTQLLASFYWKEKNLGPINAKRELGPLFDGKPYDVIKRTSPETAYQVYLLQLSLDSAVKELARKKKYVAALARHMRLTLLSLVVRVLDSADVSWGHSELTKLFQASALEPEKGWIQFVKTAIDHIQDSYQIEGARYRKVEGRPLQMNYYFKGQAYAGQIFTGSLPRKLKAAALLCLEAVS